MQLPTIPKPGRLTKVHTYSASGIAAVAGVAILAVAGVQGTAGTAQAVGEPAGFTVHTAGLQKDFSEHADFATHRAAVESVAKQKVADVTVTKGEADTTAAKKAADRAAEKAAAQAAAKKAAAEKTADAAAKKQAADAASRRKQQAAANRSTVRKPITRHAAPAPAAAPTARSYANNVDGWIRESLDVMAKKGIPGSYQGIYKNLMRESSGNPRAINNWDVNAAAGIPSKGLLQVIDPTFRAYHVAGTSWDIYDPVANITAACNYAADRYGSMNNVNSAY